MGKRDDINELTALLSLTLTHRIGSLVNPDEIYSEKYRKESDVFLKRAIKISLRYNWNMDNKIKIREFLEKKLRESLEKRDFLDNKKFKLMEKEINSVLKFLNLN
jgi:hypothetical protein